MSDKFSVALELADFAHHAKELSITGIVLPFAGSEAPDGWLFCYGQAVSRETYARLFEVIGTTYGTGDGSTTFNVPDLRGRVVAGKDDMGGVAAGRLVANVAGGITAANGRALGGTGGAATHTLAVAEMPSHDHSLNIFNGLGPTIGDGPLASNSSGSSSLTNPSGGVSTTYSTPINNTGGGSAHNNVQPTIVLNYIIKT